MCRTSQGLGFLVQKTPREIYHHENELQQKIILKDPKETSEKDPRKLFVFTWKFVMFPKDPEKNCPRIISLETFHGNGRMYKQSRTQIHNPNKPVFAWKCMEIRKKEKTTSSHTFGEVSGKKILPEKWWWICRKRPEKPPEIRPKRWRTPWRRWR